MTTEIPGEISINVKTSADFAKDLKDLCIKYKIGECVAHFRVLIGDHSISHIRTFEYKAPTQNDSIEYCQLVYQERRSV